MAGIAIDLACRVWSAITNEFWTAIESCASSSTLWRKFYELNHHQIQTSNFLTEISARNAQFAHLNVGH